MKHEFLLTTTDYDEVRLNYEFPDFYRCESIVDEAEFEGGADTGVEVEYLSLGTRYQFTVTHDFLLTTTDINEVISNYEVCDFSSCESLIGEPELVSKNITWVELSKCNCDQCDCDNVDDYTEEGTNCEECYRDCVITEG
jgi:hypothetical protein